MNKIEAYIIDYLARKESRKRPRFILISKARKMSSEEQQQKKNNEEGEEEALKPLEIENGLRLVPRVKLNLTVYPSTPLTLSHPIDEWKMKRALIDFLHSSHSLTLPEDDDLHLTRLKDLKKRKRDDPVAAGTLRIWDLSSFRTENHRFRLTEKLNGIELNLEGVKFRLAATVPVSDDFQGMKKDWEEHSAFRSRREPDTVVLRGVPSRWFAEPRVSSKPSMLVTHTIFSTFGKIRSVSYVILLKNDFESFLCCRINLVF